MAQAIPPAPQPYQRSWFSKNFGQLGLHTILIVITLIFLIPLMVVISASVTDEVSLTKYGYGVWPSKLSFDAYNFLLLNPTQILRSYGVTAVVTAIGTLAGLLIMSLLAYAMSRQDFTWRRPVAFFVFFTMLFNGGLVPTYILVTQYLKLRDTLAVLILPYLVVPWFVFLLRTYFQTLPKDFIESAKIDGANEWQIYLAASSCRFRCRPSPPSPCSSSSCSGTTGGCRCSTSMSRRCIHCNTCCMPSCAMPNS